MRDDDNGQMLIHGGRYRGPNGSTYDLYGDLFAPVLAGGQRLEAAEAELGIEPEESDA